MQNINVEELQRICINALQKYSGLEVKDEVHITQVLLIQTNLLLIEILQELQKQAPVMVHRI